MTTTFPYPDLDTLTPQLREAFNSRASLNIFRMIAYTPGLAPGFLTIAAMCCSIIRCRPPGEN
jgi:hypothetical protein